jgi:hypothetical protein
LDSADSHASRSNCVSGILDGKAAGSGLTPLAATALKTSAIFSAELWK